MSTDDPVYLWVIRELLPHERDALRVCERGPTMGSAVATLASKCNLSGFRCWDVFRDLSHRGLLDLPELPSAHDRVYLGAAAEALLPHLP